MASTPSQILSFLHSLHPGKGIAFVVGDDQVYYAAEALEPFTPWSPLVVLLQQVFDQKKDHSFFLLRKRIYTNYELSARDQGMLRVVAKRSSKIEPSDEIAESLSLPVHHMQNESLRSLSSFNKEDVENLVDLSQEPLELLKQLAQLNPRGDVLHDYDREIAALLVSSKNEILAYGVNCNHINKTLHAEVNLALRYFRERGEKISRGSKIYVTHKPCKMCAGMIYDCAEEREAPFVFYIQDEPGGLSRNTVLDQFNLCQKIED